MSATPNKAQEKDSSLNLASSRPARVTDIPPPLLLQEEGLRISPLLQGVSGGRTVPGPAPGDQQTKQPARKTKTALRHSTHGTPRHQSSSQGLDSSATSHPAPPPPHPRPTPSPVDKQVVTLPSFEVFYRGSRVAQVSGPQLDQVELKVKQFGYAVSKTDLFSDDGEYGGGGSERDENGDFAWDRMADKTARDSKK